MGQVLTLIHYLHLVCNVMRLAKIALDQPLMTVLNVHLILFSLRTYVRNVPVLKGDKILLFKVNAQKSVEMDWILEIMNVMMEI